MRTLACEQAFGPSLSSLFFPQTESLFTGYAHLETAGWLELKVINYMSQWSTL